MEGLEKDSREDNKRWWADPQLVAAMAEAEENLVRRHGPYIHWRGNGGGDAMVLCKSTLGLPILSEENF